MKIYNLLLILCGTALFTLIFQIIGIVINNKYLIFIGLLLGLSLGIIYVNDKKVRK